MPELTELQRASLRGQVTVSVNTCRALRRYNPNLDVRECLEGKLREHQARISRENPHNGLYINLARDFLQDEYDRAMNPQQQAAGKRRRGKRRTVKRIRKAARHTRKGC
jgi:hypothetical protein